MFRRKKISESKRGKVHSEKTLKLISEKLKGRKITEEHSKNMSLSRTGSRSSVAKPIINILTKEIFSTIREGAESVGVVSDTLSKYIKNKDLSTYPFVYLKDYNDELEFKPVKKERKKIKKVICYETLQIWDCVDKCAKDLGIPKMRLRDYLIGNYSNKTKCVYLEDYEKGLNPNDLYKSKNGKSTKRKTLYLIKENITFKSLSEACSYLKLSFYQINKLLNASDNNLIEVK